MEPMLVNYLRNDVEFAALHRILDEAYTRSDVGPGSGEPFIDISDVVFLTSLTYGGTATMTSTPDYYGKESSMFHSNKRMSAARFCELAHVCWEYLTRDTKPPKESIYLREELAKNYPKAARTYTRNVEIERYMRHGNPMSEADFMLTYSTRGTGAAAAAGSSFIKSMMSQQSLMSQILMPKPIKPFKRLLI